MYIIYAQSVSNNEYLPQIASSLGRAKTILETSRTNLAFSPNFF